MWPKVVTVGFVEYIEIPPPLRRTSMMRVDFTFKNS